jgi:hypothetical protein
MAGKPGRSGPKPGNLNALKNGSKLSHHRLVVGELPRPMISCKREARAYRRELERTVLEVKSVIDPEDCHLIDAAVGATIAVAVNRWLLRNRLDTMTVADIRACNKEMRDAKRDRAKIVKELGLRVPPKVLTLDEYLAKDKAGEDHEA